MQRMSRAQRILVIYLLLKLQEPRIIKRIIRNYGGGIGKHGNDMHTSAYSTATSIADLATKDHDLLDGLADDDHTQYLLHDGTRAMTGDLDMNSKGIKFGATYDVGILPVANSLFIVNNALQGGQLRSIRCLNLSLGGNLQLLDGAVIYGQGNYATSFDIYAGSGATGGIVATVHAEASAGSLDHRIDILRGGDITMLASKMVDCYTNAGYLKPRRLSQSAEPTPDTGELLVWRDTDDDTTWLVYEDPDVGGRKIELT